MTHTPARSHLEICLYKPRASNYTPESLIIEWAKENRRPYSRNRYGKLFVSIGGIPFVYESWKILPLNSATERVSLSLVQISAWEL